MLDTFFALTAIFFFTKRCDVAEQMMGVVIHCGQRHRAEVDAPVTSADLLETDRLAARAAERYGGNQRAAMQRSNPSSTPTKGPGACLLRHTRAGTG